MLLHDISYLQHSYSPLVVDHFLNPRNVGSLQTASDNNDNIYVALLGSEKDGAAIQLQIKTDSNQKIIDAKFKAYGGVATIACASWLTQQIIDKNINEALEIQTNEIAQTLNLPNLNFFSAILAYDALQATLNDFIKG